MPTVERAASFPAPGRAQLVAALARLLLADLERRPPGAEQPGTGRCDAQADVEAGG